MGWQLAQNAGEASSEAFCYLGEFFCAGGGDIAFDTYRMRNIEKWLYQREYHGATTPTTQRSYNKSIFSGSLGPGASSSGWFSRRGASIGFAVDGAFITGARSVAIKVTYRDVGTSSFTLVDSSGSTSILKKNSGEVRTVTWFRPGFAANASGLNPDFWLTGDGNTDFMFVRVVKT
jgi:hypothetical protein